MSAVVFPLSEDEIQVWHVPLDRDSADLNVARGVLDEAERARHDGFRDTESARNFMLVRAALRMLMGCYLNTSPAEILFQYGTYGKPGILRPAQTGLEFNVSHAHDCACLAFAKNQPVGVDIENRFHRGALDGVARRFFTPGEQALLDVGDEDCYRRRFFTIWTAKEALLKVGGEGIAHGLEKRVVTLDAKGEPCLVDVSDLHLHVLSAPEGYFAAVATAGYDLPVREIPFEWEGVFRQANIS